VSEAPLESTEHGLAPAGRGWFVVNAHDAIWIERPGRGAYCEFEGLEDKAGFSQLGINLQVLGPGEPMSMYHFENDQEDFLVLDGEPLLIAEGQERSLGRWDFVHCPAGTSHVIVGAGERACMILAIGARDRSTGPDWGAYTVDPAAIRHDASVDAETTDPDTAYARFPLPRPVRYREGWIP
jgi:uncharacterized cupin superfamily protein